MSTAQTAPKNDEQAWRDELRHAIRSPRQLIERLGLSEVNLDGAETAHGDFPLLVPHSYIERIEPGRIDDPLLRQVMPTALETTPQPAGFSTDPLAEQSPDSDSAILQKYANRALLVTTGACAIHCRYCFRRSYPYSQQNSWRAALRYWHREGAPEEVILSGGDPLMLGDQALCELIDGLEQIAGLRRLRIHTRMPIALPARITTALVERFSASPLQIVWVVHANHPQEINDAVCASLARLRHGNMTLLNQSVLLRGVNDDPKPLAQLSEQLFSAGALPYYLHQLDRISGAAHFAVSPTTASSIIAELAASLPGYLLPRLVREDPGAASKTTLAPPPR
ncbi:lysyl-lysine 2,3-aminomutase [Halorhodospira halochloris]|uniref:L-lysine 2,3-aminomutase n=1 Tax=Halorhodospira halochloris TaxID=1052 RepID=A0A0X8XAD4_HALHR|nr:EF-P beta-lysylation protein EpmB [Halorhodospira halochloris]MBK1652184.1 EF-P beta-lysylation protein EpmB [Halorhodospira halochloris]BAU58396.1 lysyl-lysine 2,3-aminomutase [Halorhodospira halochloris]